MDDKVFNLLEKMYADLTGKIDGLTDELKEFKQETKEEFRTLKNQVTKIEIEHGKKLEALLDGHIQNTKLLEEVQDEVARHEEVIIKRVK